MRRPRAWASGRVEVGRLAAALDHEIVVTDRRDLAVDGLRAVPLTEVTSGGSLVSEELPDARPHLVLTTGTTGAPRGVRHDWGRLLRSTARIRPARDERWLLAYGLHQFAGLQILLHTFGAGATLVTPADRRPAGGLEAIRAHDVRHVSATPTWWRLLLATLAGREEPPPPLAQITLGGEAAPASLLAQLEAAFPDARISHIYAATEFGSTGSVRDGRSGLDAAVLERGGDADIEMKVVDGELWVRSSIGMLGYHGEAEVDPDAWRPTGDLVEVVDGRIQFLGRDSDVINVGGVKVHPLVVEELVAAVPGVTTSRVFGRENPITGSIVAVEVVPAPGVDPARLKEAVWAAFESLEGATKPRSVRVVDEIATRGDKVLRRDIRD